MSAQEVHVSMEMYHLVEKPIAFAIRERLMTLPFGKVHQYHVANEAGMEVDYCGMRETRNNFLIFAGSVKERENPAYGVVYIVSEKQARLQVEMKLTFDQGKAKARLSVGVGQDRVVKSFESQEDIWLLMKFVKYDLLQGDAAKVVERRVFDINQVRLYFSSLGMSL